MSPKATLVEFIVTSASFHGVKRQSVAALEDELFRVFRNNIMPANGSNLNAFYFSNAIKTSGFFPFSRCLVYG